jgi:phosphoribosylanthranilate isomerase
MSHEAHREHPRSRPRVKICGVTRWEDADLAIRLGADAIGFVLWDRSARYIAAAEAASIAARLPPFVTRVGVVVDIPAMQVADLARVAGLDAVQLHGDEPVAAYTGVAHRLIKAVSLEQEEDVARALALPADVTILVDAADRTRRGGTGQRANWAYAAELARVRPIVLAGGLTAETVGEAIDRVRPWAVDVSSGVEDAPGVKSARRLERFFEVLEGV